MTQQLQKIVQQISTREGDYLVVVYGDDGCVCEAYKAKNWEDSHYIESTLLLEGYRSIMGVSESKHSFDALIHCLKGRESEVGRIFRTISEPTHKTKKQKYEFTDRDLELISKYQVAGVEKQIAWSYFVRDKQLNPGCDAKDFYKEYDK